MNYYRKTIIESLTGGVADNKTIEDIANKHSVPVKQIQLQLMKGVKVEFEHTNDKSKSREIAMDHLWELPDYYDRLENMEH
jgi:hypothetical protein